MNAKQSASFHIWSAAQANERDRWLDCWNKWSQREIYAHPDYVQLDADRTASQAYCACLTSLDACVLYPFILRDLRGEPFWNADVGAAVDLITPYGYGGAFAWGADVQAISPLFWQQFEHWAKQQNVVSEFVRSHLFDTTLPYPGKQELRLQNVVRSLTPALDDLWMDFKHKVRKNIKKAERSGVTIEFDATGARLDDFLRLYENTMDRRNAKASYYFPRSYFERIHTALPGQFMYVHAIHNHQVISTELVLVSAETVYSFLGGSDRAAFDFRPNELLKYEIMRWAKACGKQQFVLGGGYTDEDGIFQYKLGFAPTGAVPFRVGHRVLRPDLYDQLVNNRLALLDDDWIPQNYFPLYRAGL